MYHNDSAAQSSVTNNGHNSGGSRIIFTTLYEWFVEVSIKKLEIEIPHNELFEKNTHIQCKNQTKHTRTWSVQWPAMTARLQTTVSTTMPLRRCVSSLEPPEAHMYTLHTSNVLFITPTYLLLSSKHLIDTLVSNNHLIKKKEKKKKEEMCLELFLKY